jgi:hypothetical protein
LPKHGIGPAGWLQFAGVNSAPVDRLKIGKHHVKVPIREP